ncbi:MAG: AAA family ATPase [Myxococcales bacterium]|nr:AAA family ATPase [Myxococcales bacterium]
MVEADETSGSLFVAIDGARPPSTGTFYVRPFEFTALLKQLYTANEHGATRVPLSILLHAAAHGSGKSEPTSAWTAPWNIVWGPPGTGKTRLIGARVAELLEDPGERILVVSTTNDATDLAAISVGKGIIERGRSPDDSILRVGRGARYRAFEDAGLRQLLQGHEYELRRQIEAQRARIESARESTYRARLRHHLATLTRALRAAGSDGARDERRRVVVTTAFQALSYVVQRDLVDATHAPFTTVVIDEAGLISRTTVAALALLASRRVVLAGDPRQLAPITKIARILPPGQARWLGLSALHHLRIGERASGLEFLAQQHRMHPEIRQAVSAYQYGGCLADGPGITTTSDDDLPEHRALWYVLDEERCEPHHLRADRGEGNRSWVRSRTPEVLGRFFSAIPQVRDSKGLFISPFVGQCRAVTDYLRGSGAANWRASTVHQQQGAEADVVIFDTVNAGSTCWPLDEWERLINVAASRAKKLFVLLATRDEARQPFLAPLVAHLHPCAFVYRGKAWKLEPVERAASDQAAAQFATDDQTLGAQLARRKALRPLLSAEQQRLCRFEMDGKPRLVRGVAGSGKTVVLANWLVQTYLLLRDQNPKLWVVFANRALQPLLQRCITQAWELAEQRTSPPWTNVELHHIESVLAIFEGKARGPQPDRFDYNERAQRILAHRSGFIARCDALFMDEAQDLGPSTIALLTQITKQTDTEDTNSRSVNIFYDNAQNVYGRGTPKWADLGIDLRGRSVVMKESFRSTRPITEFALNTLAGLVDFDSDADQREYIERRLIEKTTRECKPWWQVNYNEIGGPSPQFKPFATREKELTALVNQIYQWLKEERVLPRDIAVVTMGKDGGQSLGDLIAAALTKRLKPLGIDAEYRTTQGFDGSERSVVVTTPHSFKGYEAEVVWVAGLDAFHHGNKPAASPMYVALTRARSVLVASATAVSDGPGRRIVKALKDVSDRVGLAPSLEDDTLDEGARTARTIQKLIGPAHGEWFVNLLRTRVVALEPIENGDGELLAEPAFIARDSEGLIAFYLDHARPSRAEHLRLEDAGIRVMIVGEDLDDG